MNIQQKQYLIKRIDNIENEKLNNLKPKVILEEKIPTLREAIKLILTHQVSFNKKALLKERLDKPLGWKWDLSLEDIFNFSKFRQKLVVDNEDYLIIGEKIKKEATKLKDKCMLGDAEEAIQLLSKFEEKKF